MSDELPTFKSTWTYLTEAERDAWFESTDWKRMVQLATGNQPGCIPHPPPPRKTWHIETTGCIDWTIPSGAKAGDIICIRPAGYVPNRVVIAPADTTLGTSDEVFVRNGAWTDCLIPKRALTFVDVMASPDDRYPHKCPKCDGPAYVGLTTVECKGSC